MERAVHEELVEGAVEEGRVDGDDRVQSGEGQAGSHGRGVLLGDAHVEGPLGELVGKTLEPHRNHHRCGDGDDVLTLVADAHHRVAELIGPAAAGDLDRQPGLGVDHADAVELIGLVVDRVLVAAALLGEDVDEHRTAEGLGLAQGVLERLLVVTIDGSDIFQAEVLEHPLRRNDILEALLDPVEGALHRATHDRCAPELGLAPVENLFVALGRAQGGEMVGEATDGRGVGAFVVVDDDDQGQVLGGGDVVDRLPRHPAGERPVTDDSDRMPSAFLAHSAPLSDAVGPGQ